MTEPNREVAGQVALQVQVHELLDVIVAIVRDLTPEGGDPDADIPGDGHEDAWDDAWYPVLDVLVKYGRLETYTRKETDCRGNSWDEEWYRWCK